MNAAVLLSSSLNATEPLAQLLVGFTVVEEYAEYDACDTTNPDTATAAGTANTATILPTPRDGRPPLLTAALFTVAAAVLVVGVLVMVGS